MIIAAAGLWLCAGSTAAQVTASEWDAHCWGEGGGYGLRWCQAFSAITIKHHRMRFVGSIRLMRSETGEHAVVLAGDKAVDRGGVAVDSGPVHPCSADFDCKLSPQHSREIINQARKGGVLVIRFTPRGLPAQAFSLSLEGYRTAIRESKEAERMGF